MILASLAVFTYGIIGAQDVNTIEKDALKHLHKLVLRREFSRLTNSTVTSDMGNYASVKISEAELALSPTIYLSSKSHLKFNLKAGATEGISTLLSGGKLSPRITLSSYYNFIVPNWSSAKNKSNDIYITRQSKENFLSSLRKVINKNKLDENYNVENVDSIKLKTQLKKIEGQILKKKHEIKIDAENRKLGLYEITKKKEIDEADQEISKKRDLLQQHNSDEILNIEIMTLEYQKNILINKKYELDTILVKYSIDSLEVLKKELQTELDSLPKQQERLGKIRMERNKKIKELFSDEKLFDSVNGIKVTWISIGVEYKRTSLNRFDPKVGINSQVYKDTTNNYNMAVSINKFNSIKPKWTWFNSIGISYRVDNNIENLTKIDMEHRLKFNSAPDEELYKITKNTVYLGELIKQLNAFNLYWNHYSFFGPNKAIAYHLYAEMMWKETESRSDNLGIGLLYSFIDASDKKSKVNVEIFYSVKDLLDNNNSGLKFFERGTLGLQVGMPLNIKFNKYAKEQSKS